ncbi:MAG TPA: aspartate kinase [Henriciella marina]|jgi:aspartate kinase|uniref:Aspartokinase n=1 Tax=Henriciella algicola TaxID=1608422 RepID=A0A399RD08_9PROT|nr:MULTISPECIES: aspartate kinase [Henriciella]QYI99354.1 aspartate kinase [Thalassovita mediterranea]RIJ27369.1 aspartate kinase [Henriciella algicola]HIG21621.1 aspartate kinase [Henriciella sp.]HIK65030.1 aspartate kinase [Henriciella marina]
MQRTVLKFGGTSVGDLDRIAHVADLVSWRASQGEKLAVIVSAMAGETNKLVGFARGAAGDNLSGPSFDDEYDVVVSSGEQVTSGLLALALRKRGLKARSWLGWQLAMKTSSAHGKARIMGFENSGLLDAVDGGEIAVIAGFQGVTDEGRVSTLGRGGSDTSAVAVAAALGAESCDIYTDVDGVYTTDPRIVPQARRLDKISYEEMLEMASLGAKVLQTRSVELAMNHQVRVRVLSSFAQPGEDNPGTYVCSEDEIVEKQIVNGVTYSRDEAKVTLYGVEDKPGVSARIFSMLADAGVNVDMIVQANARGPERANMVFTCTSADSENAEKLLLNSKADIGFESLSVSRDVAKVSVIGVGMKSHTGVAGTMFDALYRKGINIDVISTSEIKISVLIDAAYTELAVRALHTAFGLDAT